MTTQPKIRAFIAVDVGDRVRGQVARVQNALRPATRGVKWVDPSLCHITLNFLGYVALGQIDGIARVCRAAAHAAAPLELEFRGVGAFPNPRRARVLWIGLGSGEAPLAALQARLTSGLQEIGFEPEGRPFSPHLTLGRFKVPGNVEELVKPSAHQRFGRVRVAELRLMRSDLRPSGPIYTLLEAFALGPAEAFQPTGR
jgi:2'-5' RNA ligase